MSPDSSDISPQIWVPRRLMCGVDMSPPPTHVRGKSMSCMIIIIYYYYICSTCPKKNTWHLQRSRLKRYQHALVSSYDDMVLWRGLKVEACTLTPLILPFFFFFLSCSSSQFELIIILSSSNHNLSDIDRSSSLFSVNLIFSVRHPTVTNLLRLKHREQQKFHTEHSRSYVVAAPAA
jgi:hypothetical protein